MASWLASLSRRRETFWRARCPAPVMAKRSPFLGVASIVLAMHCTTPGDVDLAAHADGCPVVAPYDGSGCALPDGTSCGHHYPQPGCLCCGTGYLCEGGRWQVTSAFLSGPWACPADPPIKGSACGLGVACIVQDSPCQYDCPSRQGGVVVASCVGNQWQITPAPCFKALDNRADASSDAPIDSPVDAPSDAPGDSPSDAPSDG